MTPHPIEQWAHLQPNRHCHRTITLWGSHVWRNPQGQYHRVDELGNQDGPALILKNGENLWYIGGLCHRLEGPAWVMSDGRERWFLDNKELTQEEWASDPRVIELHSRTQEEAESWLTRL